MMHGLINIRSKLFFHKKKKKLIKEKEIHSFAVEWVYPAKGMIG